VILVDLMSPFRMCHLRLFVVMLFPLCHLCTHVIPNAPLHVCSFLQPSYVPAKGMTDFYKLSRSKLRRSLLRTLRMVPSLKNFSSPAAVRPPMYHLSAPSTSRNPSLLLSLPRRRFGPPGMGTPPRGECSGYWFTTPADERVAEFALPPLPALLGGAFDEMARGADAAD